MMKQESYTTQPGQPVHSFAPGQIVSTLEPGKPFRTLEPGQPTASSTASVLEEPVLVGNHLVKKEDDASDNGYANIAAVALGALLLLAALVFGFKKLKQKLFK